MESVRPTPVNQLRPYTKEDKIRIRICRIWKSTIPGTVQKYTNLHCILVDETQHAVEASTLDVDYDVMASKIEAGACYEITEFRTVKIRGQYKVVPHETQVLFTSKTAFQKLASVFLPIPRHRFFPQDYYKLYPRLTVSSSTSIVEPNKQSFKRKMESIRQALFTGGEQSGVDQISDTDPREFDELPIKLLMKKSSPTAGKPDGTPPKKT